MLINRMDIYRICKKWRVIRVQSILNLAVVNFRAKWGDKVYNLERIKGYMACASKKGVEFLVFPEMCLTGYDDDIAVPKKEKMQVLNAESISGVVVNEIAHLAKEYNLYVVMGMPEIEYESKSDTTDKVKIYNSVLIGKPDGTMETYRKIHLALNEPKWATPGEKPCLIETPWGKIGICICYDIYSFPELVRYYVVQGARLVINATAYAKSRGFVKGRTTLESTVLMNGIYVATANLCGKDLVNEFWGGSSIIGPSLKMQDVHYYAGYPFGDERGEEQEIYIATIDLSLAHRGVFEENPLLGRADFRAEIYAKLYEEIAENIRINRY